MFAEMIFVETFKWMLFLGLNSSISWQHVCRVEWHRFHWWSDYCFGWTFKICIFKMKSHWEMPSKCISIFMYENAFALRFYSSYFAFSHFIRNERISFRFFSELSYSLTTKAIYTKFTLIFTFSLSMATRLCCTAHTALHCARHFSDRL